MQYMLLIYEREADVSRFSTAERDAFFQEYMTFTQNLTKSGHIKGGDGLQPVSTATTVRVRDGKTMTTDGPFAETREQLGGYYLIEAKDLDEAITIAARVPSARHGSIEIRPVMVYS